MSGEHVPHILAALESKDPNVIRVAVRLAGHYNVQQAGKKILPLLTHSQWQVRETAADALGRLRFKPAEPHLTRIVSENDSNLRRAILANAALKEPVAQEGARDDVGAAKKTEEHWRVRKAAALALNRINPDIVESVLLASLKMDNKDMLMAGMGGLTQLECDSAGEHFMPLLDHPDPAVRLSAVVCMGKLAYLGAASKLIELLDASASVIKKEAIIALNHIKDPRAIPHFIRKLKDGNKEVRMVAAVALGNTQKSDPEIVEALAQSLTDASWEVRSSVCSSLANLKAEEAVDGMINLLSDDNEELRRKVALSIQTLLSRIEQRKYDSS